MATQQFAKVTIGYDTYIAPLSVATKLVELFASMTPVDSVDYTLVTFEPELDGKFVAKKPGEQRRIALELTTDAALPHFDQQEKIDAHRAERDGPTIAPYAIRRTNSKYELFYTEAPETVLKAEYSYSDVLTEAQRLADDARVANGG